MDTKGVGFRESFLKEIIWSEEIWDLFMKFMYGQTISQIDGENVYHYSDVQNFCLRYDILYPKAPKSTVMKTDEFLKKIADLIIEYEGRDFQISTVGCEIFLCEPGKKYSFDGEKFVEVPEKE